MEATDKTMLSSMVKFSEIFLWDDVMDGGEEAAYSQNKKKYFHSEDEDDDDAVVTEDDRRRKVDYTENGGGIEVERVELSQQMNAMGLPLSFNSSKKNMDGSHRGSRKSTHLRFSPSYSSYAEAVAAGSFRVVNTKNPKCTYLELKELVELTSTATSEEMKGFLCKGHADCLTDDYPVLTRCSSKNKKKTTTNDLGLDHGTVLSYPAESAVIIDANKDLNGEMDHEYVEPSSTSDHSEDMDQFSNGVVEQLLEESNRSSDALEDLETNENNCYGEFEDWRMYWDDAYQQYYYYNINTTESTWEPPPILELQPPDDMVISGEHAVDDCISSINSKPIDEDKPLDYCVACGHKNISRLPPTNELISGDFDIKQCSGCHVLSGEMLGKFCEASIARRNRKSRKSRARKTSHGIIEGDVTKYWCQRYSLFSKFDDGIKMDEEGWYSVTPEKIAEHHASRCGTGVVLDLFTGVGGNAIQFAQRSALVIAVDIDPIKIAYAQHNAAIYGVCSWIDFIEGNSFAIAPTLKADSVYLSPPWGGPEYAKAEVYDLKTMLKPHNGYFLFNTVKHIAPHIVMFLPRNVDVGQLVELAVTSTPPWSLEVEKNFLNGKLKAVTAYFRATENTRISFTEHECQTE